MLRLPDHVDLHFLEATLRGFGARLLNSLPAGPSQGAERVYGLEGSSLLRVSFTEGRFNLEAIGHDPDGTQKKLADAFEGARVQASIARPLPEHASEHLPHRPRLAQGVSVRRHLTGTERQIIVHDRRAETTLSIDEDSLQILEVADGSRDLEAIVLALVDRGAYRGITTTLEVLEALDGAGVLEDGLPQPPLAPPIPAPETSPADRPLEVLPGFSLHCDGSGACCRSYGSVAFSEHEAMQARLLAPQLGLPLESDALFTPAQGALRKADPQAASMVALCDGNCVFLAGDGLCKIHGAAGAAAKPFPCQFYPAMLIDDGESIRVSLGPECACVMESIDRPGGRPLVPVEARKLGDLPLVRPFVLPSPYPVSGRLTASLQALRPWSRMLVKGLETSRVDAVSLAWALAEDLGHNGLQLDRLQALLGRADAPDPSEVRPWLHALVEAAGERARWESTWRSASDLSRQTIEAMVEALHKCQIEQLFVDAPQPREERFYLRALAHGHRLSLEGRPLDDGLRDRATRILCARAISAHSKGLSDPALRYPLTAVEAAMRSLGLTGYRPVSSQSRSPRP